MNLENVEVITNTRKRRVKILGCEHLRRVPDIGMVRIPALPGTKTILKHHRGVFQQIGDAFGPMSADEPSVSTPAAIAFVFETRPELSSTDFFALRNLTGNNIAGCMLTQDQVLWLCKNRPDILGERLTTFPFTTRTPQKRGGDFIAKVWKYGCFGTRPRKKPDAMVYHLDTNEQPEAGYDGKNLNRFVVLGIA